MENWILARTLGGNDVKVRQGEPFSRMFIGEDGIMYDASDLNFTGVPSRNADIFKQLDENNKRYAEQQAEYQEMLNKMLSSMDANAVADHKAEIDEREYWRRLRGNIALEMLRCGHMKGVGVCADYGALAQKVKVYFDELYNQDKEFFKEGEKDGKDSH